MKLSASTLKIRGKKAEVRALKDLQIFDKEIKKSLANERIKKLEQERNKCIVNRVKLEI